MLKNDLLTLLSSFSNNDMKKFGKFVNSPYHNTNAKASELLEALRPFHPGFESDSLTKNYLHGQLYGKGKYVEGTVNYLLSELQRLAEKFISLENADPEMFGISLLRFANRNLDDKLFDKYLASARKSVKSSESTLYQFLLSDILSTRIQSELNIVTRKDAYRKEWLEPSKWLIRFYLEHLLKNLITLTNYRHTKNPDLNIPMLQETIGFLGNNPSYLDDAEMKFSYRLVRVIAFSDESDYAEVKKALSGNHKFLTDAKRSSALAAMQVYCTNKLLHGDDMRMEEFEIAKLRLKVFRFSKKNKIPVDIFYKTFMLAISVRDFSWAKKFTEEYAGLLDETFQNNASHYCKARLLYQDGKLSNALEELSRISSFSFIHFKPAVKILQLMIFFDLNMLKEAEDSVLAFSQFLRGDKLIPEEHKKAYRAFTRAYLMLVNAFVSGKDSKLDDALMKINSEKGFLIGKKWFLEKLGSTKKKSA